MKRWTTRMFVLFVMIVSIAPGRCTASDSQTEKPGVVTPSIFYAKSHALLIGINKYSKLPAGVQLKYAVRDAQSLSDVLIKRYGFARQNVQVLMDESATKANIERALAQLADRRNVASGDRILVFFSGHGQTVKLNTGADMGFLIPSDADIDLTNSQNAGPFLSSCIRMDAIWGVLESSPAKHALVLADACYSGLLAEARGLRAKKLAPSELASKRAMQVITAGSSGQKTTEDPAWGHGAFTYKLLEELRARATTPGEVFTATDLHGALAESVKRLTNYGQTPQYGTRKTDGDFLFITTTTPAGESEKATIALSTVPPGAKILVNGKEQLNTTTPASVELDLGAELSKRFEVTAVLPGYKSQTRIVDATAGSDLRSPPIILSRQTANVSFGARRINPKDGAEMIGVPGGSFVMGDGDQADNPPHKVTLIGYYIYKYPVTVGQYLRFCAATSRRKPNTPPWGWKQDHPVVGVSWDDAQAYCNWAGVRLPTEAEWEMASRGTDGRQYPWGNKWDPSRVCWSAGGQRTATAPVGSYPSGASPYGAMDMAGNVWQWCADWYDPDYGKTSNLTDPLGPSQGTKRVIRGAGWLKSNIPSFRSSRRYMGDPGDLNNALGFRCAALD